MSKLRLYLALTLSFSLTQIGLAQVFRIQISAYDSPQPDSVFQQKGIEHYLEWVDESGIYWYSTGLFSTREEAENAQLGLIEKGFKYATVIDEEEMRVLSGTDCSYIKNGVVFVNRPSGASPEELIYFDFGKFGLNPESRKTLDEIGHKMRQSPRLILKIKGYTDGVGDGMANMQLAASRSRSARDYLIYKGVKADRMFLEVYGEAEPAAPNAEDDGSNAGKGLDLPENRKWNRRVSLKFEEKEKTKNTSPN